MNPPPVPGAIGSIRSRFFFFVFYLCVCAEKKSTLDNGTVHDLVVVVVVVIVIVAGLARSNRHYSFPAHCLHTCSERQIHNLCSSNVSPQFGLYTRNIYSSLSLWGHWTKLHLAIEITVIFLCFIRLCLSFLLLFLLLLVQSRLLLSLCQMQCVFGSNLLNLCVTSTYTCLVRMEGYRATRMVVSMRLLFASFFLLIMMMIIIQCGVACTGPIICHCDPPLVFSPLHYTVLFTHTLWSYLTCRALARVQVDRCATWTHTWPPRIVAMTTASTMSKFSSIF